MVRGKGGEGGVQNFKGRDWKELWSVHPGYASYCFKQLLLCSTQEKNWRVPKRRQWWITLVQTNPLPLGGSVQLSSQGQSCQEEYQTPRSGMILISNAAIVKRPPLKSRTSKLNEVTKSPDFLVWSPEKGCHGDSNQSRANHSKVDPPCSPDDQPYRPLVMDPCTPGCGMPRS